VRYRSGRVVPAPAWFTARLPRTPMDGVLWLGRGRFDELSGTVRKTVPVDAEWHQLRYMVFELPGAGGPFVARAQRLQQLVTQTAWPSRVAVEQAPIADRAALQRRLAERSPRAAKGWCCTSRAPRTGRAAVLRCRNSSRRSTPKPSSSRGTPATAATPACSVRSRCARPMVGSS